MARSWMELPKTASGAVNPTRLRARALPASVGTSMISLVMRPVFDANLGSQNVVFGILKSRTPSATTQRLVELDGPQVTPVVAASHQSIISAKMQFCTNSLT